MKLVNCKGKEVKVGDAVLLDDEIVFVYHWSPPHRPSSTGRVHVHDEGKAWSQSFFPGVFNMKWVD